MENIDHNHDDDEPEGWFASHVWFEVEKWLAYGPVLATFLYVIGLIQGDAEDLEFAGQIWTFFAVVPTPVLVWRVGIRKPPDNRARAAILLFNGALPCLFLYLPEAELLVRPNLYLALPLIMAWTVACQWAALRRSPPGRSSRSRALMLGSSAVICGLVALPLFARAFIGITGAAWAPPELAALQSSVSTGLSFALALVFTAAGLTVARRVVPLWRQNA